MEISRELYEAFDRFELDDLKHLNIVDRHIEQSEEKLHFRWECNANPEFGFLIIKPL